MSREESDQGMNRSYIARLITAGALVASVGGAVAPRVASAATLASATYQDEPSGDMGIEEFNAPSAPGVTAGASSTEGVESTEPVEGAPGMTGTVGDDEPQGE